MTNLTPSEARRIIENLRHNQTKEHGISILEEKYLAALEIALTVLEQQEKGEMDIIRIRELLKNNQTDTYRQIENDGSEKAAMIVGGKWMTAREGDPTGEVRRLMELCANHEAENDGGQKC